MVLSLSLPHAPRHGPISRQNSGVTSRSHGRSSARRGWQVQQQQGGRWRRFTPCLANGFENLPDPSKSSLLQSEIFVREFESMQTEMDSMMKMMRNFAEYDREGKKLFVAEMERMGEKMRILLKRLQLAKDDDFAKWVLQKQNVQMLNASTSWGLLLDGLQHELAEMRRLIELEESTADPQQLAMIKEAWRQRFASAPIMTSEEMERDPDLVAGAMHPDAMKAVTEVLADPSAAEKYRDNPPLYKLLMRALGRT